MKVIPEKPIDYIYIEELEAIAKWYECTTDEVLKQCIALHHIEIKRRNNEFRS